MVRKSVRERADVALQVRVALDHAHDVVVVVGERGGDDLALVGVAVAADAAARAAAEHGRAEPEVGFLGTALGGRDLHARTRVGDQHAGLRLLELEAADQRADRGTLAPGQPADGAADAARVAFGEHDGGRQDEIRRDHLAAADIGAGAHLAAARERPRGRGPRR